MSKRLTWALALVLVAGCNNNDAEPTATRDEQEAIRPAIAAMAVRQLGTDREVNYLAWEGTTVPDHMNNSVRVVRVKFQLSQRAEMMDCLYRFADGHPIQNRLNGSGDRWHDEAALWVKGKP